MAVTMAAIEENDESSVTRIYVSGLPPSTTNDQVRSHFAATGKYTVTDAHVIPERRIAFVGFSNHEHARSAVQYFNRSFVRMSKISVELAKPVQVRRDEKGQAVPISERASQKRKRNVRDDGEQARHGSKPSPQLTNGIAPKASDGSKIISEEKENQPQADLVEEDKEEDDALEAPRSDTDWLRGKTNRTLDLVDEAESGKGRSNAVLEPTATTLEGFRSERHEPEKDDVPAEVTPQTPSVSVPNARLFIRNLPFDTQQDDLRAVFARHGRISEVSPHLLLSRTYLS